LNELYGKLVVDGKARIARAQGLLVQNI